MMLFSRIAGLGCGFLVSVFTVSFAWQKDESPNKLARIGIVGGGIGGTATAYFVKELFKDSALVDLYEPGVIGGRLATADISGQQYEIGGSIIHPKNKYMTDFVNKLGLKVRKDCDGRFGIYDGEKYVFLDGPYSFVTIAKLIWRYGWDIYRLDRLTSNMLSNFARIYTLQNNGIAFKNLESLLKAMDPKFVNMTKLSTIAWMKEEGFHDRIIDELVMATTRANYGQSTDIHAFVGAISIAGADSDLWAVDGGNKKVPEELLKSSRAARLERAVTKITATPQGTFMVSSVPANETHKTRLLSEGDTINTVHLEDDVKEERMQEYDIVIVATPLTSDKSTIKFLNFTEEFTFPGHYERIVCTMVDGRLKPAYLNIPKGLHLNEVLTTSPRLYYNAIGKQDSVEPSECVEGYEGVWKIFSPQPLTEDHFQKLFRTRKSTSVTDWLAYPHYKSHQDMGKFELIPGLYYVNAIEKAGSAMEMSSISAKNAALLAFKYWSNDETAGRLYNKEEL